jgi:hypothetical protein
MTPRKGSKYIFKPVFADRGYFADGAIVTVVGCPGMPKAKVPRMFRYVTNGANTVMVLSASLTPLK